MNVNRRGLFGLMGGAAVAGPGVAKQVLEKIGHGPGLSGANYAGAMVKEKYFRGATEVSILDSDWAQESLKRAMKNLAAVDETPKDDHTLALIEAQRIDTLRSVSPASKARLIIEHRQRLERENQRGYWQREIDELKKQLGPLAAIL